MCPNERICNGAQKLYGCAPFLLREGQGMAISFWELEPPWVKWLQELQVQQQGPFLFHQ